MSDAPDNLIPGGCYLGLHEYTVDQQRRVPLPRSWREGDAAAASFYMLPGRGGCIQLIPQGSFAGFLRKVSDVSFFDPKVARAMATLGSAMEHVSCDRQGRIVLPPLMMGAAGIEGKVILVGAVTTIQIWEPSRWDATRLESEESLDILQAVHERPDDFEAIVRKAVRS